MKIIFLDFDGVLNTNRYFVDPNHKPSFILEDDKIILLKQIIDKTNAKIVLSTSWREIWGLDLPIAHQLKEYFESFNIEIYGKTDSIDYNRVLEIKDWISKNNISTFCILDDITGPWDDLIDHVVVTNLNGNGLDENNVQEAIKILKE